MITQNDQDVQSLMATQNLPSIVIRNACRIREELPEKENMILWVARSLPIKRPDLFLKLAREFPEERFVMICPKGTGDMHYEQLQSQARSIRNLTFLSHVPFHNIDAYFEKAKIFVCTSDAEGFPNTFVQASKSGTAILSLAVNPDQFLTQQNCGVCANGQWDLFSGKLKEWIETNDSFNFGRNGRDYAHRRHDIQTIISQYKTVFQPGSSLP